MIYPENVESQPDRIAAVRHPDKVERRPDIIPDVRHPGGMSENFHPGGMSYVAPLKGDRLRVQGVETPPPDDTECASLSGATPSEFPKRTCGALPYPDSLKGKHTALVNITPRTIAYPIRICCPDH